MNQKELHERLLAAIPGASFAIWSDEPPFPPDADPTVDRLERAGFYICWAKTNAQECPTMKEIEAVTLAPVIVKSAAEDIVDQIKQDPKAFAALKAELAK